MDVARITDEESFEKEPCSKVAVMYAVAYQYEHREDCNHLELTLSIRAWQVQRNLQSADAKHHSSCMPSYILLESGESRDEP